MPDHGRKLSSLGSNFHLTGIIPDLNYRLVLARNTAVAREIGQMQGASPQVAAVLGEAMLGAFLLSSHSSKSDRFSISLHLECTGPVKRLIAFSSHTGAIRGHSAVPEATWTGDLRDGLEGGLLKVSRWKDRTNAYTSAVELHPESIARSLELYAARSDQIQSFIRILTRLSDDGRLEEISGFMLQALPDAGFDDADAVLELAAATDPEQLVSAVVDSDGVRKKFQVLNSFNILHYGQFFFLCDCNRDKIENLLKLLGRDSVENILAQEGKVEIICEFCKKKYQLNATEINNIFPGLQGGA